MNLTRRASRGLRGRSVRQLLVELAQRGGHHGYLTLHKHLLGRRYIEKRIHDFRLLLDADDPGISRQLLSRGSREPEQKFIIEHELKAGMVAFDLGANLGYYTVMMAKLVGCGGRVYAVEPFPRSFELLGENIRRNGLGNVRFENVAIADRDGERPLMITDHSNWHSFHVPRLNPDLPWHRKYARPVMGFLPVRTRSLETYLADKPPIDFLRMDIEGYEVEILGCVARLAKERSGRMKILFETHPEFYDPIRNDIRSVLGELCNRHGYRIEYLVSDYQFGSPLANHIEPARTVFERYGYGAEHIVRQFRNRAIYSDVRTADAIELIATSECVNAALLAP